jgi:hypothetical protein
MIEYLETWNMTAFLMGTWIPFIIIWVVTKKYKNDALLGSVKFAGKFGTCIALILQAVKDIAA